MPSSAARAHRGLLVTVLCAGVTFAHAQQLRSIESLNQSYVTCVQSAFALRLDDFGVSSLTQAAERAFLDCQPDEDALYTTALASAPGNTQAMALGPCRGSRLSCSIGHTQLGPNARISARMLGGALVNR
jgi:hypothetical protein